MTRPISREDVLAYPGFLRRDSGCRYLVRFRDLPEVSTQLEQNRHRFIIFQF